MTRHSALRKSTIPLQSEWSGNELSRALIGRAQSGDVDAFELIYNEHSGRVYALCPGSWAASKPPKMVYATLFSPVDLCGRHITVTVTHWLRRTLVGAAASSTSRNITSKRVSLRAVIQASPKRENSPFLTRSNKSQRYGYRAAGWLDDGSRTYPDSVD